MTIISEKSYDDMPYESYPYPQSSPDHLRTIGVLFGMNPSKLKKARVLELGCASGGNLLPFAHKYPDAEIIGVDLSEVQINDGKELIKKLGIKNVDLRHISITDIDESFGKFDYIISHGVFSWVPKEIEEKMLEICGNMLTDNGIAYISYNTLPGWNMVRSIRDMMLYHSAGFESDQEKVNQSRLLLDFIKDSTEGSDSAYSKFLRNEVQLLANQPDHYIRHEHLETMNNQFYFSDFISMASKNGLQYLGDASITSMYIGNLPKKAHEKLSEIKDIVRTEQYMDYVTNRRFRSTLLCKSNVPLNRNLQPKNIDNFYLNMKVQSEKDIKDVNFADNIEALKFFINGNKDVNISTTSPIMKAVIYTFIENSNIFINVEELVEQSSKKIKAYSKDDIKNEIYSNVMKLVLSGYISISSEKPLYKNKLDTDKPKISKLVKGQSEFMKGLWASNLRHERIGLSAFDKIALRYFDGKSSFDDVTKKVYENHIKNGELNVSIDNQKITDEKSVLAELDKAMLNLKSRIDQFAILPE